MDFELSHHITIKVIMVQQDVLRDREPVVTSFYYCILCFVLLMVIAVNLILSQIYKLKCFI